MGEKNKGGSDPYATGSSQRGGGGGHPGSILVLDSPVDIDSGPQASRKWCNGSRDGRNRALVVSGRGHRSVRTGLHCRRGRQLRRARIDARHRRPPRRPVQHGRRHHPGTVHAEQRHVDVRSVGGAGQAESRQLHQATSCSYNGQVGSVAPAAGDTFVVYGFSQSSTISTLEKAGAGSRIRTRHAPPTSASC